MNDPEFIRLKDINEEQRNISAYVVVAEHIPILKIFLRKHFDAIDSRLREFQSIFKRKYQSHQKDYEQRLIRDFTDALTFSKNDSLINEKESVPYLTDDNLILTLTCFQVNKFTYKLILFDSI